MSKSSSKSPTDSEQKGYSGQKPVTLVSVVTVCLNAEETIESTLLSVAEQRNVLIEHVVIDGGSEDKTKEIVEKYSPKIFVSEKDRGIYYAMQKGAQLATGDIVFFLNSGDLFSNKNIVNGVVEFFNAMKCDAVFGNLLPFYLNDNDTHDHKAFNNNKILDLSYFNNRRLFYNESIHHQTIFYRRHIFDKCGFICENPVANGEYHLNVSAFIAHGYSVKHYPHVICHFALGGKSTSNFKEEWLGFVAAREVLRKTFFPIGPNVSVSDENEYLIYPPSSRNRIKIFLRKIRRHLSLLRRSWNELSFF